MEIAASTAAAPASAPSAAGMIQAAGTIAFVDPTQRFGILRPDPALVSRYAGLEHVFFAVSELGTVPATRDMRVTFEIDPAVRDDKGYAHASNLRPA